MHSLPRANEIQLKAVLGDSYTPKVSYRAVLVREQKRAITKGWRHTGKYVNLGSRYGETPLFQVPGEARSAGGGLADPLPPKAAAPKEKKTLFKKTPLKKKKEVDSAPSSN